MRLQQDVSSRLDATDACPVCGALITLVEVEPHPSRDGLEIQGFSCEFCGPVKSQVVACQLPKKSRFC
jgi:hypothetical protein